MTNEEPGATTMTESPETTPSAPLIESKFRPSTSRRGEPSS
jgi:hypothetical protein